MGKICTQIWACLAFNLLWMANPWWGWDSGAQFEMQHQFSFDSSILCQLQLIYLVDDANIIKRKETIMKTGCLVFWKWGIGQFIKPSSNIQPYSPLFSSFQVWSTIPHSHKWWGNETRTLKRQTQQTRYTDEYQWISH